MDFIYTISFEFEGSSVVRSGKGLFYPHDGGFNLEHMLWLMTEEFGRPTKITVEMDFTSALLRLPNLIGRD